MNKISGFPTLYDLTKLLYFGKAIDVEVKTDKTSKERRNTNVINNSRVSECDGVKTSQR